MKNLFLTMVQALERGENVVLCSILASSGSAPRGAGAKMAVFPDGTTQGTIGGGAVERIAAEQAMALFETGASYCQAFCLAPNQVNDIGMICAGSVFIFGGGHVGKALVPVLAGVGFRVTVFDNRAEVARPENFPQAERVIFGDYNCIGAQVQLSPRDFAVIMTPGHQADREVLLQAMRTPACYIGCIGSRHKVAATNRYLVENGIPEAELSRIHSPIGLEIFAETPEEIAISIAAELIRHRAICSGTERAKKG